MLWFSFLSFALLTATAVLGEKYCTLILEGTKLDGAYSYWKDIDGSPAYFRSADGLWSSTGFIKFVGGKYKLYEAEDSTTALGSFSGGEAGKCPVSSGRSVVYTGEDKSSGTLLSILGLYRIGLECVKTSGVPDQQSYVFNGFFSTVAECANAAAEYKDVAGVTINADKQCKVVLKDFSVASSTTDDTCKFQPNWIKNGAEGANYGVMSVAFFAEKDHCFNNALWKKGYKKARTILFDREQCDVSPGFGNSESPHRTQTYPRMPAQTVFRTKVDSYCTLILEGTIADGLYVRWKEIGGSPAYWRTVNGEWSDKGLIKFVDEKYRLFEGESSDALGTFFDGVAGGCPVPSGKSVKFNGTNESKGTLIRVSELKNIGTDCVRVPGKTTSAYYDFNKDKTYSTLAECADDASIYDNVHGVSLTSDGKCKVILADFTITESSRDSICKFQTNWMKQTVMEGDISRMADTATREACLALAKKKLFYERRSVVYKPRTSQCFISTIYGLSVEVPKYQHTMPRRDAYAGNYVPPVSPPPGSSDGDSASPPDGSKSPIIEKIGPDGKKKCFKRMCRPAAAVV